MTDEPEDQDWAEDEKGALGELARGVSPPAELEESVVTALRGRGLLPARPRRRAASRAARASWGLLAAAALVAVGFALGRTSAMEPRAPAVERTAAGGTRYVLLLLSDGPEPPAAEEARRVAEYKEWARSLAAEGRLAGGAKLAPEETVLASEGQLVPPPAASPLGAPSSLGGFFMITARDHAEAVAVARGCPHLRYGGRIILRRVE